MLRRIARQLREAAGPQVFYATHVDLKKGHNKFYAIGYDGDLVAALWGRIGSEGRITHYTGGKSFTNKQFGSKISKGYTKKRIPRKIKQRVLEALEE